MYTVYQASLSNKEVKKINSIGWDAARKELKSIDEYCTAFLDKDYKKAFDVGRYKKVAQIEANNLDDVFTIGNMGPDERIIELDVMFSVSVGDIIEDSAGDFYVVAPLGFNKL